jgi:Putative peptidoglycan binding domain
MKWYSFVGCLLAAGSLVFFPELSLARGGGGFGGGGHGFGRGGFVGRRFGDRGFRGRRFRGFDRGFFDFGFSGFGYPYYYPYYYPYDYYYYDPNSGYSSGADLGADNSEAGESRKSDEMASLVQAALAKRGYDPGPIDGIIGVRSRRAIQSFQTDQGLRVTGSIDGRLIKTLRIG